MVLSVIRLRYDYIPTYPKYFQCFERANLLKTSQIRKTIKKKCSKNILPQFFVLALYVYLSNKTTLLLQDIFVVSTRKTPVQTPISQKLP